MNTMNWLLLRIEIYFRKKQLLSVYKDAGVSIEWLENKVACLRCLIDTNDLRTCATHLANAKNRLQQMYDSVKREDIDSAYYTLGFLTTEFDAAVDSYEKFVSIWK